MRTSSHGIAPLPSRSSRLSCTMEESVEPGPGRRGDDQDRVRVEDHELVDCPWPRPLIWLRMTLPVS